MIYKRTSRIPTLYSRATTFDYSAQLHRVLSTKFAVVSFTCKSPPHHV